MSSVFSKVLMKFLSFFSAALMLILSPGGSIRQPLISKCCPSYYGQAAVSKPLDPVKVP